ncbi:alkaline phosphatase [Vibrio cincinnatiensis]|uniref:alkaline phosphatase n=1 Tax=Vibrio cincinnatiensis TaxID=675 RepID=UPI001EE0A1F7|nr:alkaline phosphatase [Vibrio cincinnatiensis]MCG3737283.1 alkaline phosphatase [Vibrio cincinnatiensis]MCG3748271.1 alkaline phosphatase [Vibrio cincinnatiensis]MCG3760864.1 alkaline phosphatase [Vibrio cincinnatiensis]MCG3764153.1 alkaline phosphatase [Vibrio cincinnatiensis]
MSKFNYATLTALTLLSTSVLADAPKHVIYLIGDGMATAQRQVAEYYLQEKTGDKNARLAMNSLPITGINTTHSADSLVTDSAASATALATGMKTDNGMVGMLPNGTKVTSLLEGAQKKGMATGLITTTRLTHATPAAFIAKNISRDNENEIAQDYTNSGITYFAGGGYRHFVAGKNSKRTDGKDLVATMKKNDYRTFVGSESVASFRGYHPKAGDKVFAAFSASHEPYEIDRIKTNHLPSLAEMTEKGIDLLAKNKEGFFLMIEGGRIDHASHANDIAGTIFDTLAFDQAVQKALDFYHKNPDDTLVIVTGDHETGGMGMGFGKNYFMTLDNVTHAKESIEDKLQGVYQGNRSAFYQHIAAQFDLSTLSDEEKSLIETAMNAVDKKAPNLKNLYGGYDPVAIAVAHITSKRAGVYWTSYAHTATQLPLSAIGVQADKLGGFKDNTQVAQTIAEIMQVNIGYQG